jgi:hypothetical protein
MNPWLSTSVPFVPQNFRPVQARLGRFGGVEFNLHQRRYCYSVARSGGRCLLPRRCDLFLRKRRIEGWQVPTPYAQRFHDLSHKKAETALIAVGHPMLRYEREVRLMGLAELQGWGFCHQQEPR